MKFARQFLRNLMSLHQSIHENYHREIIYHANKESDCYSNCYNNYNNDPTFDTTEPFLISEITKNISKFSNRLYQYAEFICIHIKRINLLYRHISIWFIWVNTGSVWVNLLAYLKCFVNWNLRTKFCKRQSRNYLIFKQLCQNLI